jgi:hypothetical protein
MLSFKSYTVLDSMVVPLDVSVSVQAFGRVRSKPGVEERRRQQCNN